MRDSVQAWGMQPDGSYRRRHARHAKADRAQADHAQADHAQAELLSLLTKTK